MSDTTKRICTLISHRPPHLIEALDALDKMDAAEILLLIDLAGAIVENRTASEFRAADLAESLAVVVLSTRGRDLVAVSPVVRDSRARELPALV